MSYLPPFYTLQALIIDRNGESLLLEADKFPVAIIPYDWWTCRFTVFGALNSAALAGLLGKVSADYIVGHKVSKIVYSATVTSSLSPTDTARKVSAFSARFTHDFTKNVELTETGLVSRRVRSSTPELIRYQKQVDGMPSLPNDWRYLQFVA